MSFAIFPVVPTWDPILFSSRKIASAGQDPLLLTVCNADVLTNDDWMEYLLGAQERQGSQGTKLSAIRFVNASINATQRHQTKEYIAKYQVPAPACNVVFVENEIIRGAMIAFTWILRSWKIKPYAPSDYVSAFGMLSSLMPFDSEAAVEKWKQLHTLVGSPLP